MDQGVDEVRLRKDAGSLTSSSDEKNQFITRDQLVDAVLPLSCQTPIKQPRLNETLSALSMFMFSSYRESMPSTKLMTETIALEHLQPGAPIAFDVCERSSKYPGLKSRSTICSTEASISLVFAPSRTSVLSTEPMLMSIDAS